MKRLIPILLILIATAANAEKPQRELAFGAGEQLTYAVSYKVGFITTDVAEVKFTVDKASGTPSDLFNITAWGRVYPSYRWFFDLNDTYTTTLDATTLKPVTFRSEISEGKYRFSSRYDYDWKRKEVNTIYRNHKRTQDKSKTMPLGPEAYDGLALFYNLRNGNMGDYKENSYKVLNLVLEDTIRSIRFTFLGRERKQIKGLGKCNTLKFSCQLATSTGEAFPDGSEFFVWISDDRNKIPLYIESPIRVGSIRGRLIGYELLKYPFESRKD